MSYTPDELKAAQKYFLEQAGWVHHPDHVIIGGAKWKWTDPGGNGKNCQPTITRAMIKKLVEEKSYRKNHKVHNRMPFTRALWEIMDTPLCKSNSDWEFMIIFSTLDDLLIAFHRAYGSE